MEKQQAAQLVALVSVAVLQTSWRGVLAPAGLCILMGADWSWLGLEQESKLTLPCLRDKSLPSRIQFSTYVA